MFFRRAKPRTPRLEERLADLERAGFTVTAKASGETHIARGECAAELPPGRYNRGAPVYWRAAKSA